MKSSLRKLRYITLNKNDSKEKSLADHHESVKELEELQVGIQDVDDMREQYDGLLAVAQGISGSAYDFSRSIQDMASYMLETFGKIGDGETGNIFSMLGKVQYEISKLLDLYALHVSQTIISPTDSLLKELQSIEEMKRQYEEKRQLYNQLKIQKMKGRGGKKEKGAIFDRQIQAVKEEANDLAVLLGLRFQSLKLGQDLSLVTQAARHHTAQLHLFGKGVDFLNAVEPVVKHLSQEHKIDRTLSEGDIGIDVNLDEVEVDGEGLEIGDEEESMSSTPSSFQQVATEKDPHALHEAIGTMNEFESNSKSAPISSSMYFSTNSAVNIQEFQPERPVQKAVTTYALPSPVGSSGSWNSQAATLTNKTEQSEQSEVSRMGASVNASSSAINEGKGQTGHGKPEISRQRDTWQLASTEQKIHLWNKASSSDKNLTWTSDGIPTISQHVDPLYKSGPVGRSSVSWMFVSPRISPSVFPPHLSPPHISELHKLPTPPSTSDNHVAYSAPLGMKSPELSAKLVPTHPQRHLHQAVVTKSRSIPSSGNFAWNLQDVKSPISEGVSLSPPSRNISWQESTGKLPMPTEGNLQARKI